MGWGSVLLPTHNGHPLSAVSDSKQGAESSHLFFVNMINTTTKHQEYQRTEAIATVTHSPKVWVGASPPRVDYKHNGHWVGGTHKQRLLCTQNMQCPIPFPLPLFSPWASQLLNSLPMGEKRGMVNGMGQCFAAHTQWASLVSCE